MPNPLLLGLGISGITGFFGAQSQANAADKASQEQIAAAQKGIDAAQGLMSPYVDAGTSALSQMMNLNGMNGADAQQTAIDAIQNSAQFTSLRDQGYNALNQNASATGGLRGGNQQAALAQFAPNMLNQLIQQQLSGYGAMASGGMNAASNLAGTEANLYGQQGAAAAGGTMAQGNAYSNMWGGIGQTVNYGLGQAMQPATVINPMTGATQANPAALPGGLFQNWSF